MNDTFRGAGRSWNRRVGGNLAIVVGLAILAAMLVLQARPAEAAPIESQCNGEMNGGGTAVACTVTIDNHLTAAGALAATPPSTVTMTRCVGASGPISTLTCATTTTTLSQPVTTVRQCNGSGSGGGGMVICAVTIRNHFVGNPTAITPATIYQCIGSVITGTGAPGTCTPANTAGVTSVSAATVGQCNGSGNGGTSVGFVCTVTGGSTMNSALAVNVDQCNGSGNGGGALVQCTATITNAVVASPGTATATTSGTPTTSTATATGTGAVPTATPGGSTTSPTVTPAASATQAATTPSLTVTSPPAGSSPPASTPLPPSVGTGSAPETGRSSIVVVVAIILALAGASLAAIRPTYR